MLGDVNDRPVCSSLLSPEHRRVGKRSLSFQKQYIIKNLCHACGTPFWVVVRGVQETPCPRNSISYYHYPKRQIPQSAFAAALLGVSFFQGPLRSYSISCLLSHGPSQLETNYTVTPAPREKSAVHSLDWKFVIFNSRGSSVANTEENRAEDWVENRLKGL